MLSAGDVSCFCGEDSDNAAYNSLKTITVVIIIVMNMGVVIIVIIFPVHLNLSYDAVNNVIDGTNPSTILTVCHR